MAKYVLTENGVFDADLKRHIPADPANKDYVKYLEWVNDGNVPDPVPVHIPSKEELLSATTNELINSLDWVIQYLILQNVIKKADIPPELDALYEARKAIKEA